MHNKLRNFDNEPLTKINKEVNPVRGDMFVEIWSYQQPGSVRS